MTNENEDRSVMSVTTIPGLRNNNNCTKRDFIAFDILLFWPILLGVGAFRNSVTCVPSMSCLYLLWSPRPMQVVEVERIRVVKMCRSFTGLV